MKLPSENDSYALNIHYLHACMIRVLSHDQLIHILKYIAVICIYMPSLAAGNTYSTYMYIVASDLELKVNEI